MGNPRQEHGWPQGPESPQELRPRPVSPKSQRVPHPCSFSLTSLSTSSLSQCALALLILYVVWHGPETLPWPHNSSLQQPGTSLLKSECKFSMEEMGPIFHQKGPFPKGRILCRRLCQGGRGTCGLVTLSGVHSWSEQLREEEEGGDHLVCTVTLSKKLTDGKKALMHMSHQGGNKNYSSVP